MLTITEGQLRFEFSDGWLASKFDEWTFYRCQFSCFAAAKMHCSKCEINLTCSKCGSKRVAGTKGVDILAIAPGLTCWQIEIKDYRQTRVSDFTFLADEVALKVRDTLSALVAASRNAGVSDERDAATQALACPRFRVVLHLEQPKPNSIEQSNATRRSHVLQRLKQLVKAIDPRPLVVDKQDVNSLAWTVTQVGADPR
jgi:hypothetical protein